MININKIKQLRMHTGASIIDCKRALIKSNDDIDLAIKYIETLGKEEVQIRKDKITTEGIIVSKLTSNNKFGVIIEINCETDFVSQNESFKNFGKKIVSTILQKNIFDIKEINKIFYNEKLNLMRKFNENIVIRRCKFLSGNILSTYIHRNKIGTLVSAFGKEHINLIKNIAMQIIALNPKYIRKEDIPDEIIHNEKEIYEKIFEKFDKPKKILEKIISGKIEKFIDTVSLLEQKFIFDSNKKVKQILKEEELQIDNFIRFEVGEKQ